MDGYRDPGARDRLRRLGGESLVHRMSELFLENAPKRIEAAVGAAASGDMAALGRAVHSLKGMAANLGFRDLQALTGVLERLAEEGSAGACRDLVGELAAAVDIARGDLRLVGGPCSGRKRVAIVEDNADNRLLVHLLLEERYDLVEYETGGEALRGLKKARPDLVLLDISLPEMDGVDVLKAIRSDPELRKVPVIAVTAHAMRGHREKYLAAGFDDYVAKPVEEELLLDAIGRQFAAPAV